MKLVLFAAMLGLAARNRFRLTPAIASSANSGSLETAAAVRSIGRSVALETGLALIILGLIAWLGTLSPPKFWNVAQRVVRLERKHGPNMNLRCKHGSE